MNTSLFYYTHKVLGVKTAIKPPVLRSAYKLSHPLIQQPDFLFFTKLFSNWVLRGSQKNKKSGC